LDGRPEVKPGNRQLELASRHVYPPSFCAWRRVVEVMAVTQVSVFLVGIGRFQGFGWQWLSVISGYAQCLALMCALGVCACQPWLQRASPRGAWIGSWLIAVVVALAFSYSAAVIGTVLGHGPGQAGLAAFMGQSVLAVALVMLALLRYLFIRSQWRAEATAQADARVQALQSRIRPHFLFNSLNTIASLIHDDPVAAERATEDLADLFRGSMQRADRLIPLADELQLARQFLDMEQRRLGERLQVHWEIDGLPGSAKVLPLILQPILENALTHGIQQRREGGQVRVFGRVESASIVITVSNPLPTAAPAELQRGHGMALRNIRTRLDLAFGDDAALITDSDEDRFYAVLTFPHVENTDH
jgi:two-component system sensor histidine kinase AlgZ